MTRQRTTRQERAAWLANPRSAAGGNYYATEHYTENGVRKGREVARQRRSLGAARRALEATGAPGYVQVWIEAEQRRYIVAERDEAGNWWSLDRMTGTLYPMDAPTMPVTA